MLQTPCNGGVSAAFKNAEGAIPRHFFALTDEKRRGGACPSRKKVYIDQKRTRLALSLRFQGAFASRKIPSLNLRYPIKNIAEYLLTKAQTLCYNR